VRRFEHGRILTANRALSHFEIENMRQKPRLIEQWTPAMAAGLETRLWDFGDIVKLIDEREGPPKKRGPYKPRRENVA
jgi:hypothetical protein